MKNRILFLIIAVASNLIVCAQSQTKSTFDAMQERYNQFKQKAEKDYNDFREQANQKYIQFLLGAWESYDPQKPVPVPQEDPLPPVIFKEEDRRPVIDDKILDQYYKDMVHEHDEEIVNPDIYVKADPIKDEFDLEHDGGKVKPKKQDDRQYGEVKHDHNEEIVNPDIHVKADPIKDEFELSRNDNNKKPDNKPDDNHLGKIKHDHNEEIVNPDIHVKADPIKDEFELGKAGHDKKTKQDDMQYAKIKDNDEEEIEDIPDRAFYHNVPKVDLPTVTPVVTIIHQPTPQPQPQPIVPIKPNNNIKFERTIPLTLYGTDITTHVPGKKIQLEGVRKEQIADVWKQLSTAEYDNVLYDCLKARKELKLCDWAYLTLLQTVAETLCGQNNTAVAMQAYLFVMSGYKMRFGITKSNKLVMLVASKYFIYERPSFNINGEVFFAFEPIEDKMSICPAPFEKEQAMSLIISNEQELAYDASPVRTLQTEKGVSAEVSINRNMIEFYDSYPSGLYGDDIGSRWAVYANTPLDAGVKRTLYPALKQAIQGKSEEEAVNVILDWVQNAFVYGYDNVIWGHDRAFFAEETMFYPYSDCEDRSILFSRLVRDLIGLDVVLVYYPGHLATAVAFNQKVHGDCIFVEGRRYVIADPTYIGASVGYTMTGKDNSTATVVMLK